MNRWSVDGALGLAGYLFIGTAAVLLPSVMPSITAEFAATGLTLAVIGLIFPAGAVGSILGNVLAGAGSDWFGRRRLVWLAALLLAASLALTATATLWLLFVAGFVVVSAAQGALSTGINALVADANRGARARALNTLHGVYGAGAAVSPLVIGYLLERGVQWRWALGGTALIWLVYAVVAHQLFRGAGSGAQGAGGPQRDLGMLRSGPFLALFVIAFAYNGIAVSLLGWIAVMMEQAGGFSIFFSVSMIAIFYVALTIGRFLCAAYTERIGYAQTLFVLAVGITLTYPLVVFDIHSPLVVVGVFLTGLSLSGLFPTVLAYGIRRYPQQAGAVSGTLSVALTVGSMLPPLWTGVIASVWSFQGALAINFLLAPPLILLALYLRRAEHRLAGSQPALSR
jgi:MFS transporter, FHS family, glucose/mannose:H+ symporter